MRLHNAIPDGLLFNTNPTKGCSDIQVLPEDNGSFLFCKKRGVYIMKKALIAILALILVAQPALQPSQTAKAADVHRQMELALNEYPGLSTEQEETSLPAGQVETLPAVSQTASLTNLYPQDLTPPEACGVPLRGPFGKNFEIFLGPWDSANGGYRIDQTPDWYAFETLAGVTPYSNITAVPLSTERIAAVWKQGSVNGNLYYSIWDASQDDGDGSPGGWSTPKELSGLIPDGNHALISPAANQIEIFARQAGKIYHGSEPILETNLLVTWYEIEGISNAASDPAVAMLDPYHKLLFYQGTDGGVWFTEWVGAWRPEPMPLTNFDLGFNTYLPIVRMGSTGAASSPMKVVSRYPEIQSSPGVTFASEVNAVSRHEKHAAVFAVDTEGRLWVNQWTHDSESDWSNTRWVKLMEGVAVEKPSVVSRHVNHIGVAIRNASGIPHYIEWTVAAGWKAPVSLGNVFASSLTLSATSISSLSVFGVAVDGKAYEKTWKEDDGWGSWQAISDTGIAPTQSLTAVVRRMDDVMVFGRTTGVGGFYRHRTSQDQPLVGSGLAHSGMKGYGRGQALPWVDGKAVWVTANEDTITNRWKVEAYDLDSQQTASLTLYDHPYHDQDVIAMAQGDLNLDGSEQVILATHSTIAKTTTISVLELTVTPNLGISPKHTITDEDLNALGDISLAIGDLNGDGIHNEVVLGIILSDYILLKVYQYVSETNTLVDKYQLYEDYSKPANPHELELTTGYLDSDICGDRQSLVLLDTTRYSDGDYHIDAQLRTYCQNPDNWELNKEHDFEEGYSQATEPAWDFYHSAVATGDVNVNGYEEIVFSFADKVVLVEPFALNEPLKTFELDEYWPNRSLAMGDIDWDGKAEVLLSRAAGGLAHIMLFETKPEGGLMQTGYTTLDHPGIGMVLLGDLDNNTNISELAGCATFHEPRVVAVVNGGPVWYQDGKPIQVTRGSYSVTKGGGSSEETGTSFKLGTSLTLGYSVEARVPIAATQIWEVRGSVTREFMYNQGWQETTENVTVYGTGYGFDDGLGIVIYMDTIYACFYYDLYHPDHPADKSRAMTCRPVAIDIITKSSLEYWHSDTWKAKAGESWVDVGHKSYYGQLTNDLGVPGNYTRSLPVDPYSLVYEWDKNSPLTVEYDPNAELYIEWWVEDSKMESRMKYKELDASLTVSAGITVGGIGVDRSFTGGLGVRWSDSTNWTESLAFGGRVYSFNQQEYPNYQIVPYVYHANARTVAGTTYKYFEVDYYVPLKFPSGEPVETPSQAENIMD
jgi:hypothetical protein